MLHFIDIQDRSVSYIEIWEFDVSMIFITGFRSYIYSAMSIVTMNFHLHMLLLPVRLVLRISPLFVISKGVQYVDLVKFGFLTFDLGFLLNNCLRKHRHHRLTSLMKTPNMKNENLDL